MFSLDRISLVITTKCNLNCRLCCEYVPQNRPFADMTTDEAAHILSEIFLIADHVRMLHLTGGGEPFLHPKLTELIELCMEYSDRYSWLMLFTNTTVPVSDTLLDTLKRYKDKIVIQTSLYGLYPEREKDVLNAFISNDIRCKIEKYYGDEQSFGGWVDFGKWESYNRLTNELVDIFHGCAVTRDMHGNWRTRDGKVHWCSRSQRGMDLGLIPDNPDDYIDLFDSTSVIEKREKFKTIATTQYISACNHCSGEQGTNDMSRRYKAAEQERD